MGDLDAKQCGKFCVCFTKILTLRNIGLNSFVQLDFFKTFSFRGPLQSTSRYGSCSVFSDLLLKPPFVYNNPPM